MFQFCLHLFLFNSFLLRRLSHHSVARIKWRKVKGNLVLRTNNNICDVMCVCVYIYMYIY